MFFSSNYINMFMLFEILVLNLKCLKCISTVYASKISLKYLVYPILSLLFVSKFKFKFLKATPLVDQVPPYLCPVRCWLQPFRPAVWITLLSKMVEENLLLAHNQMLFWFVFSMPATKPQIGGRGSSCGVQRNDARGTAATGPSDRSSVLTAPRTSFAAL